MLIVLSGMPGTGKSAVAEGIARARRAPVLSVDPIESAILRSGIPRSFETGLAAYVVAEAVADSCLGAGLDVVIDAVSSVEPARAAWRTLAKAHDTPLAIVVCVLEDQRTHAARLAARERGLAMPEPSWADVQRRMDEWTPWPEPHMTLDATDSVEVNVTRALEYLRTI